MINRSDLRAAIKKNDTTAIAKSLHICPKSRFFFSEADANAFHNKLHAEGFTATTRQWTCQLDDATDAEREMRKAEFEDRIALEIERGEKLNMAYVEILRNQCGKTIQVYTVTSNAPEAVQADANGESPVRVIEKDFGDPHVDATYLFVTDAEMTAYHGAYGFYFKNEDGELEPYGEDDYLTAGTIVYEADGEAGEIQEMSLDVAYYDINGEEITFGDGYRDVTREWQDDYGVTALLDLRYHGRIEHKGGYGYTAYYRQRNAQQDVLFARERAAFIQADNEWFLQPITDADEIAKILAEIA